MFIPSKQNLRMEQDAIAREISERMCERCKKHSVNDCQNCKAAYWDMCYRDASAIQKKFLIPLHALITERFLGILALSICCMLLLMFPIRTQRHHILELYAQTASDCFQKAIPCLKEDIKCAMEKAKQQEALVHDNDAKKNR